MAQKSLAVLETSEVVEYLREAVFEVKLAFMQEIKECNKGRYW